MLRVINLTGEDLPELQGVENVGGKIEAECLEKLEDGNPADVRAGMMRDVISAVVSQMQYVDNDPKGTVYQEAIGNEEPWLFALPRMDSKGRLTKDVAETLCHMQIGPEPGTKIPLVVPVDVRNKQWFFAGSKSDLKIPIAFAIDQNGNVVEMTNFVHRTPPLYGAQIVPGDQAETDGS